MGIYVEILVRAPIERLWAHTQTPQLHERWDLRFSRIEHLQRISEDSPQQFRYATRIGFGFEIAGEGESVGEAARTRYDYETRFGLAGRIGNRVLFRPLMAWATAWSFDRLRLWLERGVAPSHTARAALVHGISRIALAFIFLYHGLVPKLLGAHADEMTMMRNAGVPQASVGPAIAVLGVAEIALALCLLIFWVQRWPVLVSAAAVCLATISVVTSPAYFGGAFNPASLNVAVACLALIDWIVIDAVPSAARCRRQPDGAGA